MRQMRVLITGGAGFIGSALARALTERGDQVVIVDSLATGRVEAIPQGARFFRLDVRDDRLEEVFAQQGPFDVVAHYAALKDVRRALLDPRSDAEVNILGTLNVLRCAAGYHAGLFVYPSSAGIYGDAAVRPTPETAPMAPISPYGISKAAGEAYCAFFARARGLPAIALRYGTVYGPHAGEATEAGVITIFVRQMLSGEQPVIYGDGEQTRDLVYIDDVVEATTRAIDRAPRQWAVYNVATGTETTINEVYRQLAALCGFYRLPAYEPAKPGEVRRNAQDITRIREELGWAPRCSLPQGLAQVVAAARSAALAAGVQR